MKRITETCIQPFEQEHIEKVRKIGPECTALLKRDGTFPLRGPCKIAVFGSGVRHTIKGGTGSGDVNVRHFVTIEEGLKNAGFEIVSQEWLDQYDTIITEARDAFVTGIKNQAKEQGMSPLMLGMSRTMTEPDYEFPINAEARVGIYVLSRNSGEGGDRTTQAGDIKLSETEIRDILAADTKYEKFMLVLNTGGMVDLTPVSEVKNILLLGQLGTPTGDIFADLLLGKSYPSGKLAMTWAPIEEYGSTEGFGDMDDTIYQEGIYVGYRYFDTAGIRPSYSFGYGMGYTDFKLNTKDVYADEKQITVDIEVKNIGKRAGKEIVQVYVSVPWGKLDQPYQKLAGFAKTKELVPSETEVVKVSFETADMASYDTESASYLLEKGVYIIRMGSSSADTRIAAAVHLDETVVLNRMKNICPSPEIAEYRPISSRSMEEKLTNVPAFTLSAKKFICRETVYHAEPEPIPECSGFSFQKVLSGERKLDDFVGTLTAEQLAYLSTGHFEERREIGSVVGAASVSLAGGAGETTARLEKLDVPTLTMADGPAGLRISTQYKIVNGAVRSVTNPLGSYIEFFDPEQLRQMNEMIAASSDAEQESSICYQYCIAIPIGTSLAQSWNLEVIRECGGIVGAEMETFGVNLWLAPAMNIQRSPLCGRDFEYYSEDPLLAGLCAAAVNEGVQSHAGCGTTIKHFACNNQETNRHASNSVVGERALREIYLKAFEVCIKKCQPHAVMTSYNLINGVHSCNSKDLLSYVLRDEWGYEGLVMTDWYATRKMLAAAGGREIKHQAASASACVAAGNDLTMPGTQEDFEDILSALQDDGHVCRISKASLQLTAKRVLQAVVREKQAKDTVSDGR